MFWGASSRDASRAAPAAGSRHGSTALTAEVSLDLEGTAGNDRSGSARSLHGGDDALPATVTRRQRRTRRCGPPSPRPLVRPHAASPHRPPARAGVAQPGMQCVALHHSMDAMVIGT